MTDTSGIFGPRRNSRTGWFSGNVRMQAGRPSDWWHRELLSNQDQSSYAHVDEAAEGFPCVH